MRTSVRIAASLATLPRPSEALSCPENARFGGRRGASLADWIAFWGHGFGRRALRYHRARLGAVQVRRDGIWDYQTFFGDWTGEDRAAA